MAVVEYRELYTRSGASDSENHRTYTRTFLITTDSQWDDALVATAILDSIGLVKGAYYLSDTAFDTQAVLTEIDCQCTGEDGKSWTAVYTWTTDVDYATSPLVEPAEVSWDYATYQKQAWYDVTGRPLANTAGIPYVNIMRDVVRPVLKITRNLPSFNPLIALMYANVVNSDNFLGCPPGTVRMSPPTARRVVDQTWGVYYVVNFEFQLDPEGWVTYVVSEGNMQLGDNGYPVPIKADGENTSEVRCLGPNGRVLPPGHPPWVQIFHLNRRAPLSPFLL